MRTWCLPFLRAAEHAGDYRTRLEAKAEAVAQALASDSCDFAFLHVKAVDDAGHDRLPWLKARGPP